VPLEPTSPPRPNKDISELYTSEIARLRYMLNNIPTFKKHYFDEEVHDAFMSRCNTELLYLRKIIKEQDGEDFKRDYDSEETWGAMEIKLREILSMINSQIERRQAEERDKEKDKEEEALSGAKYFTSSTEDTQLKEKFMAYLVKKRGKGNTGPLKSSSAKQYTKYLFGASEHSFSKVYKAHRGETFKLANLMFIPDGSYVPVDQAIVSDYCTLSGSKKPASILAGATGVKHLFEYFQACANFHPGVDRKSQAHNYTLMIFKESMEINIREASSCLRGLSSKSSQTAQAKKDKQKRDDPSGLKNRELALENYYKSSEFNKFLLKIEEMAMACQNQKTVSHSTIEDCGRWLFIMTGFFNGARLQASSLLTNRHIIERQRATTAEDGQVILDTEPVGHEAMAFYSVGHMDSSENAGKTGHIELALPKPLSDAIINYMLVKESAFGPQDLDASFFVNASGVAISAQGINNSNTMKKIWQVMGMRITMTQNRQIMATTMRQMNLTGETGMQHSARTQAEIYHQRRREEGLANKLKATQKSLAAVVSNYRPNVSQQQIIARAEIQNVSRSLMDARLKEDEEEWRFFTSGSGERGPKRVFLSSERMTLLESIYRCVRSSEAP
jgi:hypothetical protein